MNTENKLKMLACLRAGQRDGRSRQADYDFEGWVKTTVLFLAVSGPKFMKFWDDVGPFVVSNATPFPDCLYDVPRRRHWP